MCFALGFHEALLGLLNPIDKFTISLGSIWIYVFFATWDWVVMPGNCTYRMYHIPTDKKPKLFIKEQPNGRMIAMDCCSSHLSLVIFLADIEMEITACSCVSKSQNCLRNQKFYYLDLTNRLDLVRVIYVFTHIYKRVGSQTTVHLLRKCGCYFHCWECSPDCRCSWLLIQLWW